MLSENIAFPSELADSMGITDSTSLAQQDPGGIEEYARRRSHNQCVPLCNIHADLQSKGTFTNKNLTGTW